MIKTIPFLPEHLKNIEKDGIDGDVFSFIGDVDRRALNYSQCGPAITVIEEAEHHALGDEILGLGGVVQYWKGVGEAWMMLAGEGRRRKLLLYKSMAEFLDRCFDEYGFHRIQTCVLTDFSEAHKCIMRLGFIPEGMMVHYGPRKENYMRYVRLVRN